jgi:hypothetical protein
MFSRLGRRRIARLVIKKVLILLTPLSLTPVLFLLISKGILNFDGGEKDIVLLIPWGIWAILFLITGLLIWKNYSSIMNWAIRTFLFSCGILFLLWLSFWGYSGLSN